MKKTGRQFPGEKIKLVGRRIWINNCGSSDILQE